jgi:hypothetical protein
VRHGAGAGGPSPSRPRTSDPARTTGGFGQAVVYFGNSGGLVVEVTETGPSARQFPAIGIAVQMIPFIEELWSAQFKTQAGLRYENSGYSLVEPMDRVNELIDPA